MLEQFLNTNVISFITLSAPIIVALVAIIKGFSKTARFLPIWSVLIGALFGLVFGDFHSVPYDILGGVLAGLSASGLYSGIKTVVA